MSLDKNCNQLNLIFSNNTLIWLNLLPPFIGLAGHIVRLTWKSLIIIYLLLRFYVLIIPKLHVHMQISHKMCEKLSLISFWIGLKRNMYIFGIFIICQYWQGRKMWNCFCWTFSERQSQYSACYSGITQAANTSAKILTQSFYETLIERFAKLLNGTSTVEYK